LLELNQTRRIRASDLIKDPWIRCQDLPLSVFEQAGTFHRNASCENRKRGGLIDKENIADTHNRAVD
jgi:hypothetical protein